MRILTLTVAIIALLSVKAFSQVAVSTSLQYWYVNGWSGTGIWAYAQNSESPNVTLDTLRICGRDTVSLKASAAASLVPDSLTTSYLWSNGDTNAIITVNQPGLYECRIASYVSLPPFLGGPIEDTVYYQLEVVFGDLEVEIEPIVQLPLCIPPIDLNILTTSGSSGNMEYEWDIIAGNNLGTIQSSDTYRLGTG